MFNIKQKLENIMRRAVSEYLEVDQETITVELSGNDVHMNMMHITVAGESVDSDTAGKFVEMFLDSPNSNVAISWTVSKECGGNAVSKVDAVITQANEVTLGDINTEEARKILGGLLNEIVDSLDDDVKKAKKKHSNNDWIEFNFRF